MTIIVILTTLVLPVCLSAFSVEPGSFSSELYERVRPIYAVAFVFTLVYFLHHLWSKKINVKLVTGFAMFSAVIASCIRLLELP